MKYKFTGKTKEHDGITLHQIVCVTAFSSIAAGEVGGWIEKENCLSQFGNAWVSGGACVYGNSRVYGNAKVSGNAWVSGNSWVYGNAQVSGNANVSGDAQVYGNAQVSGNARVSGNSRIVIGLHKAKDTCLLQIQGSKHAVNSPDFKMIKIGCQEHNPKFWLDNFESIGSSNNYSPQQIIEYKRYIDLFAQVIAEHNSK